MLKRSGGWYFLFRCRFFLTCWIICWVKWPGWKYKAWLRGCAFKGAAFSWLPLADTYEHFVNLCIFLSSASHSDQTIDYRCEDGRFPVSVSYLTISNPDLLSSIETGVNPGIRSWKSTYLNEIDVRKPLVVSISQKSEELRLYCLV